MASFLSVADGLAALAEWATHAGAKAEPGAELPWVILIDGRSGAGKTTFATELATRLGRGAAAAPQLIHLDDFYPGWGGLSAASRMVATDVLHPTQPGFRRWDWEHNQPADWVPLDPTRPMIIEGVGALTGGAIGVLKKQGRKHTSVTLHAPADLRQHRAVTRDPGFAQWWEYWAQTEENHLNTRPRADIQVDTRR